jgi:outer membrane immunogenic protein
MHHVLTFLASATIALACGNAASAAPPHVVAPAWTGFYIGGHVGEAWAEHTYATTPLGAWTTSPSLGFVTAHGSPKLDGTGVIAGGQIGYNWQASPRWLIGLEADASYLSNKESQTIDRLVSPVLQGYSFSHESKLNFLATVRGRIGWVTGNAMVYGTGGLAIGRVEDSDLINNVTFDYLSGATSRQTRIGWTAGGGIEYQFDPKWSLKVEYLYVDLGKNDYRNENLLGTFLTNFEDVSVETKVHIARIGLNYHFHRAPAVGK